MSDLLVFVTCVHDGTEYKFTFNYGPDYTESDAEHMFTEGNYSCD